MPTRSMLPRWSLLLDAYAQDPMGGGEALSDFAKATLVPALAARPQAFSVLAFAGRRRQYPGGPGELH